MSRIEDKKKIIDTPKILSKWNLKPSDLNKVDDVLNTVAKKLVINIIKNVLYIKEAMQNKDRVIRVADLQETHNMMNRLRFYSQMHYNLKGGSNRIVLPSSYFNPGVNEPMYQSNSFGSQETQLFADNQSFARPEFQSTQYKDDGIVSFPGPEGVQSGGYYGASIINKIKSVFENKRNVKYVNDDFIMKIVHEMNNKYSKNPISLENEKVVRIIKDSVNKNLNILLSYYSTKVSSTTIDHEKLKNIISTEPTLAHMSKTPNA